MKYYLHPHISYSRFKQLNDHLNKLYSKDTGPTPKMMDKNLWQMLRDRTINVYIDTKQFKEFGDPVIITQKSAPKNAKIIA